MLTLLAQLAPETVRNPLASEWLFHPPSIFTLFDMAVTLALLVIVWRLSRRKPLSDQQYRRLTARLDQFELAATERDKLDLDFRRTVIGANQSQLRATENQTITLEAVGKTVEYMRGVLADLPCRRSNGGECPEGHKGV